MTAAKTPSPEAWKSAGEMVRGHELGDTTERVVLVFLGARDAQTLCRVEAVRAAVVEIEPAHSDANDARTTALDMLDALAADLRGAR